MIKCSKCKIEKETTDFYKNNKNPKTNLSTYCKSCSKEHKQKHYLDNKEKYLLNTYKHKQWFLELKLGLKCVKCGFDHPAALDFHHIDPSTKEFQLSLLGKNNLNKEKILKEIDKCEVLCSNCHRIEHSIHYNNYHNIKNIL